MMRALNRHNYVGLLLMLGVAACACLFLTRPVNDPSPGGVEVAVAKKSLPAGELIKTDDFVRQKVSRNDLARSQGRIADPATVTGRTLAQPVVEGQILTENLFASEGSVQQLLSQMPPGGRLFTLTLSPRSAPDRLLLKPDCLVDVLPSARLSGTEAPGQAFSTTMLQRIVVLAVQGESVVSNPRKEGSAQAHHSGGKLQVTLLVNQKQAEALQLIGDNGNITLVVRNPLDKTVSNMQATVVSQGRLATFGSALAPEVLAAPEKANQKQQKQDSPNYLH
jgi:pilus assembly protein CpaB